MEQHNSETDCVIIEYFSKQVDEEESQLSCYIFTFPKKFAYFKTSSHWNQINWDTKLSFDKVLKPN